MFVYYLIGLLLVIQCQPYTVKEFLTKQYQVGVQYQHSLPMSAGSDRFRHINNYDAFYVTITATAKEGYVLDFLDVTASVDSIGEVGFQMVSGEVGSKKMVFRLESNRSEFLYYSYRSYGITEKDYQKMANHIVIPINNSAAKMSVYFYRLLYNTTISLVLLFLIR